MKYNVSISAEEAPNGHIKVLVANEARQWSTLVPLGSGRGLRRRLLKAAKRGMRVLDEVAKADQEVRP